jgi:hypothetical protein
VPDRMNFHRPALPTSPRNPLSIPTKKSHFKKNDDRNWKGWEQSRPFFYALKPPDPWPYSRVNMTSLE